MASNNNVSNLHTNTTTTTSHVNVNDGQQHHHQGQQLTVVQAPQVLHRINRILT